MKPIWHNTHSIRERIIAGVLIGIFILSSPGSLFAAGGGTVKAAEAEAADIEAYDPEEADPEEAAFEEDDPVEAGPEEAAPAASSILAAKYTTNIRKSFENMEPKEAFVYILTVLRQKDRAEREEPLQKIDWYLICDTQDNLYISGDLESKRFICSFPDAANYKFGIRQNGDIIAVYRSEFSEPLITRYSPMQDAVRRNPFVLLAAENYSVIHEVDFGELDPETMEGLKPCGWVENCGFCSLPGGDVMFAEYTRMGVVYTSNCWRIKAGADLTDASNWEIVKQFRVAENDKDSYDESVIEHFHTVQMDPYTGIVYIATGDTLNKSQMWYSDDGGDTWTQQTFVDPENGRTVSSGEKLFRILNFNFTRDYVYWSSDSSRDHAILRCERDEDGGLDPDSVTILEKLSKTAGHSATYGTVLLEEEGLMVLMERCDAPALSMEFRVYDLWDDELRTVAVIDAAGGAKRYVGFRTEYTEFDPPDGVIKVGFGANPKYRNVNDLCGNAGDMDWTYNINNMWIRVKRGDVGQVEADFGYYSI